MGRTIAICKLEEVARRGLVTRARVDARTHELALLAGRVPPHVTQSDYEQAKREVRSESDIYRQEAMFELVPEAKRGNPVPGSIDRPSSATAAARP